MKTITEREYAQFQQLKEMFIHSTPEASGAFFICGASKDTDEYGLPESILVCPSYGVNIIASYRKVSVGRSGQ